MRMMDELKHLFLYSSNKKVYAPIDEKDKRKNSAILLLTPNLEESSKLMKLPYIYNPNLFTSFYVDRNVMAYIDNVDEKNIEFDEQEEEKLSEAMYASGVWSTKCKFKFNEEAISIMDKKYIDSVYNANTVAHFCKLLGFKKMPEEIKVEVYPTIRGLRYKAPTKYKNTYDERLYSYSDKDTIHVLSKYIYDPEYHYGQYELYLKTELINYILQHYNPDLPILTTRAIGLAVSGADEWIRDKKNGCKINLDDKEFRFAYTIRKFIRKKGYYELKKFIQSGDMSVFVKFSARNTFDFITGMIFESELSYSERQRLLPSEFGVPDKRKYPLNDEDHVRAAVRMFNQCDPDDEKELAENILKKMKKFGITDIKVSAANRFKKYYNPSKPINESSIIDSSIKTDEDLLKWMESNITYSNFTTLKTPEELYNSKTGSCHDQVLYELTVLRKLGYKNVKAWFIIEYDDIMGGQGGETHSVVTYKKNGKYYYFENAWSSNVGIHKLSNDKFGISNFFENAHKTGKWGNVKKYKVIDISEFNPRPGMTLQEIVDDDPINESTILNELAYIPDNKIIVGTDFHFVGYDDNHENIIIKPKSYIEKIIKEQNDLTGNNGIFIYLGDLLYKGFHSEFEIPNTMKEEAISYIKRFKGKYKILIRGNHDNLPDEFYIKTLGFTHVCSSLIYGNILFTHQPEVVNAPMINVHGHIHGERKYVVPNPKYFIDVYVCGKKDVHMDTLPNILEAQPEYEKTIKQGTNIKQLDPHLFVPGERLDLDEIISEAATVEIEDPVNEFYNDVLKVCSHLSEEELKRITFHDTYRDSKYVIKRIIARADDGEPLGFLDVYQFPSNPEIAQITFAVDNRYHGQGIGDALVKEMLRYNLQDEFKFDMYYWTVNPGNDVSAHIAMKNGFIDTGVEDKYGRRVYIMKFQKDDSIWDEIPEEIKPTNDKAYISESAFITNNLAIFSEADNEKIYSQKLRQYLYKERIKNNKGVLEIYEKMKATNPEIKKMYLKVKMYKHLNLFVDLSYYHSLFLQNNIYKMDKAVNFYFDFLNRLINNPEIDNEYHKKTIFIPVDAGVWPVALGSDITDYRKNLNPISIIFRLVRTNLPGLKKAWGNKDIIFVGSRGYFKIDFNKIELKSLSRIKKNINKLMSMNELIEDDEDIDDLNPDADNEHDIYKKNADSKKALTAKVIDKIEDKTSVKIDDVSGINNVDIIKQTTLDIPELSIITSDISMKDIPEENGAVIINIDPAGPDGFIKLSNTQLKDLKNITMYCMP